jgi:hypothetical protein
MSNGGVQTTPSIISEFGQPEAAVPLPDGRRIPVDLRMPTPSSGGGSVTAPVSIHIDATGADPAALGRVQAQLATLKAELPATVVASVRQAKKKRQL